VAPTQAFVAMHWGGEYLGGASSTGVPGAGVNVLTLPRYCPTSRQPELKHAAVRILRAELPWRMLAMAWLAPDQALRVQRELREQMRHFPFALCVPFGSDGVGVLFRAAGHEPAPDELLARVEEQLGLGGVDTLRYADRRRGQRRTMRLLPSTAPHDSGTGLQGFLLAGDTASEAWVRELLLQRASVKPYGHLLLKSGAAAPGGIVAQGRLVCTCFGVSQSRIESTRACLSGTPEQRLSQLQASLRCGTNCGSCVPELKRLLAV